MGRIDQALAFERVSADQNSLVADPNFLSDPVDTSLESTAFYDPQYVVINVADFYFIDWAASEASWSSQVKPEVIEKLEEIRQAVGTGSAERRLAWSTLLEYTDRPLDTPEPSEDAAYVVQAQRILEVAEEIDLPVFMPLNGFQWWNEVPELWNHWDPDGTQTPGCGPDEFEIPGRCRFEELRDPEFRERFIAGYDPENIWNVEWQDWVTPMQLNWRNWGGGGIQLAPPPNLMPHNRAQLSYHQFQEERYKDIISVIANQYQAWQAAGREDLFAGLSIGTEVSLNASVTPQDEFKPYGYRGIQDIVCPKGTPVCGDLLTLSEAEVRSARLQVVNQYLHNLSKIAVRAGIPKQRVYTHVWSEAEPGEPRYEHYLEAAITPYSRPSISLYGQAQDPLSFQPLARTLAEANQPAWGAAEFSTDKTAEAWRRALQNTMNNPINPAKIIAVYNWREHVNTPAVPQMRAFLADVSTQQSPPEISVDASQPLFDPIELTWSSSLPESSVSARQYVHIWKSEPVALVKAATTSPGIDLNLLEPKLSPPDQSFPVDSTEQTFTLPPELAGGLYYWAVEQTSTAGAKESQEAVTRISAPAIFTKSHEPLPQKERWWVDHYLRFEDWVQQLFY